MKSSCAAITLSAVSLMVGGTEGPGLWMGMHAVDEQAEDSRERDAATHSASVEYARTNHSRYLKAGQRISAGPAPLSPEKFNPDPGVPPIHPHASPERELPLRREVILTPNAPNALTTFNPDPGVPPVLSRTNILFDLDMPFANESLSAEPAVLPPDRQLRRVQWQIDEPLLIPPDSGDSIPAQLQLPREEARRNERLPGNWSVPHYSVAAQAEGVPTNAIPRANRWEIPFAPWQRYTTGQAETPYASPGPRLWHPYEQSVLKGDAPLFGQDIFLNLTASFQGEFEARRLPVSSGSFAGVAEQFLSQNYLGFSADLFRGETVLKPALWTVRVRPVVNVNHLTSDADGALNPNTPDARPASQHRSDTDTYFALQEAFGEVTLAELSDHYDFLALRAGNQAFNSDFRGFIFNDVNTGVRLFGNADNNRWQYNLAVFDQREKDTRSELNSLEERGQRVIAVNAYRQDFLRPGYTAQWSLHASFDEGESHRDQTGKPVRPASIGTAREHSVRAFYLGWAGDGHIGRLNVSHAFYQALGRDDFNGLAGRAVDINAQMAALELSLDRDWLRYKASAFYASGDGDARDGSANGFDAILDSPAFAGAPFSYFARQGFALGATGLNLKGRNSLLPSLRASKLEGQSSFVNPGVLLAGLGADARLTPKLRSFAQVNYIRFADTDSIEAALGRGRIGEELGFDLSLGFAWRPLLTENVIVTAGFGGLLPGNGFHDINTKAQRSDFLYSGLLALTLTY